MIQDEILELDKKINDLELLKRKIKLDYILKHSHFKVGDRYKIKVPNGTIYELECIAIDFKFSQLNDHEITYSMQDVSYTKAGNLRKNRKIWEYPYQLIERSQIKRCTLSNVMVSPIDTLLKTRYFQPLKYKYKELC